MAYGRHSVLTGEMIDLRVIFRDDANDLIDPDATPSVYIYDSSVDTDTLETELSTRTFTSALAGPLSPTSLSTGFYELNYTVPSAATEGIWHDVWVADIDTVASDSYFSFNVDVGADLSIQQLLANELIVIELDESIGNVAADATLGLDVQLAFSTVYNPLYASPDLVRLEIGTFINYIPDDTLALMIHWASKEADFIAKPARCNVKDFEFARTKFVIFDSALKAILLPGGASGSNGALGAAGTKKQLGDLMIDRSSGSSGASVAVISSGVDLETLNSIRSSRDEWWRVVNAGGCIVPGQGFAPVSAVKGRFDPDRRLAGRLWWNPEYTNYAQPGANAKIAKRGYIRGRHGFTDHRRLRGF